MKNTFLYSRFLLLSLGIGMYYQTTQCQPAVDTLIDKTAETTYAYGPAISLVLGTTAAWGAKNIVSGVFRFSSGLIIGILLQEIAHQYLKSRTISHKATKILYNKKTLYSSCDRNCKNNGDTFFSRACKQTESRLLGFFKDVSVKSDKGINTVKDWMNTKPQPGLEIKRG